MSDSASDRDPVTLAQDFLTNLLTLTPNFAGYDASLLRASTIHSAHLIPTPTVVTRISIKPSLLNSLGNLHGGATATIFDCCTSIALSLIRKEGFWELYGVSRNLNVCYLSSVGTGEEIEVTGEVVSAGKRMAHLRGEMRRVRDGGLVATCVHEKVNVGWEKARL